MTTQRKPRIREPLGEAALWDYASRALARRMRSEVELRRLMRPKAQPGDEGERAVAAVIDRLKQANYLSDVRFAADYTRLRKENEKLGRRRVQQDLAIKGIATELANSTLGEAYEGVDEVALARQYIQRKRMKEPAGENKQKEASRVMGRLLRAGFSAGAVFKVLRDWGVEADEFEVEES